LTPSSSFLLDWHPGHPKGDVLLVSPCSGHGFKFCSVMGEVCAQLLSAGASDLDVSLFSFESHAAAAAVATARAQA